MAVFAPKSVLKQGWELELETQQMMKRLQPPARQLLSLA
jgi:hypothetical protein